MLQSVGCGGHKEKGDLTQFLLICHFMNLRISLIIRSLSMKINNVTTKVLVKTTFAFLYFWIIV